MAVTVKIDAAPFQKAVKQLISVVPLSGKAIIKNESRLLIKSIVDVVKPNKGDLNNKIQKNIKYLYNKAKFTKGGKKRFLYRGSWLSLDKKTLAVLSKNQVSHIGFFASNFMGSGNPLQVKAPQYVARHKGVQGKTIIKTSPISMSVTILNATDNMVYHPKTLNRFIGILNAFIKGRSRQIQGKLRGIMSGRNTYRIPNATK